ncbi:MAG: phosphoribosylformylglycinamidine synthase [Thermoleophilia bacterium]|nr:phosphoribosylformylglycinamidine synthase [Thermoleophilia bacterium]
MTPARVEAVVSIAERVVGHPVGQPDTEWCFYVEADGSLGAQESAVLDYALSETFEPQQFGHRSFLEGRFPTIIEYGPRLNFETAWSSNAVEICHRSGARSVRRLERSVRLGFAEPLSDEQADEILAPVHDRMTEMRYPEPLASFGTGLSPEPVRRVPLLGQGIAALHEFDRAYGCSWDSSDLELIAGIFRRLERDPTDVELFQIAQANSEHSRHWVFKGELWVDGERVPEKNLMEIVKQPLAVSGPNSVIAFRDDSSAIRGTEVNLFMASEPLEPSPLLRVPTLLHPTLTAETHNFPSGVAPYPGAATGGGGRIRDNQAVGRGGLVCASGAAYCVGNLHLPGYTLPWEEDGYSHPPDLASPAEILIEASNGASDYGNCFGEPLIYGFTRTYGLRLPDGYRSWFKPIMYSVGAGQIRGEHTVKGGPETDMLVVQVGGPAYRIGMGGGAASSMEQGENVQELDFNAVQRGDPEMEQRVNRLMRACVELGDANPIVSAHDLGAGGDCNALPEIVEPAGAVIDLRAIPVGDKTLSVLEIWGNESQERNALLVRPTGLAALEIVAARENVPLAVVGRITGDGVLVVYDSVDDSRPVDLPLDDILGQLPPKRFEFERRAPHGAPRQDLQPLVLPPVSDLERVLEMVLRLPAVCSKRFLTNKVDLDVTGLVIQRQLVGPRHVPLSDYAVIAQTYDDPSGTALSLGEQPIKGLISPGAGVRMAVAEALLNMAGAVITGIRDIKCSANWMLAVKQPGEGAWLYDAACALRDILMELGIAIDGGKDSLSMASQGLTAGGGKELVKAPPELVMAPYALMPDVELRVTPDLKEHGNELWLLPVGHRRRLGGSALAQVLGQLGEEAPDIEDPGALRAVFEAVQELVRSRAIVSCHDISDGGLIVTLLEMAFAGDKGWTVSVEGEELYASLFAEEAGVVVEVVPEHPGLGVVPEREAHRILEGHGVKAIRLGHVEELDVELSFNLRRVMKNTVRALHAAWEETAYQLERLQQNPACAEEEWTSHSAPPGTAPYRLTFDPDAGVPAIGARVDAAPTAPTDPAAPRSDGSAAPAPPGRAAPKAAILREEGTNGDRELAAAFAAAGFEVWDVTMTDLIDGAADLERFQLVAFPGGFAFADVLDAAKGWASVIRNNERLSEEFARFFARPDTLSLGVCNGCQLVGLLGIPGYGLSDELKPRFIRNTSARFESRFTTVSIEESPALMLQGMEGSVFGVYVAHGEGRLHVPDPATLEWIVAEGLAPVRYVDPEGYVTTAYPYNPNGSPQGIAALCSPDGRHLAIMPHPERCFQLRQWPWVPPAWRFQSSPWMRMFRNAYAALGGS